MYALVWIAACLGVNIGVDIARRAKASANVINGQLSIPTEMSEKRRLKRDV